MPDYPWYKLPIDIKDYLMSDGMNVEFDKIIQRYGLNDQQIQAINELVWGVLFSIDKPAEMDLEKAVDDFGIEGDKAVNLLTEVLNLFLVPIDQKYNLGVAALMKEAEIKISPVLNFDETVLAELKSLADSDPSGELQQEFKLQKELKQLPMVQMNKLAEKFRQFLTQPEVRQVLEEVEKFEKLTRLRQGSGRAGKLEIE